MKPAHLEYLLPAYSFAWLDAVKAITDAHHQSKVVMRAPPPAGKKKRSEMTMDQWYALFDAVHPSSEIIPFVDCHDIHDVPGIVNQMRAWNASWPSTRRVRFTRWWLNGLTPWRPGHHAAILHVVQTAARFELPSKAVFHTGTEVGEGNCRWMWDEGVVCDHELDHSHPHLDPLFIRHGRCWINECKDKKDIPALMRQAIQNGVTLFLATDQDSFKEPPSYWKEFTK
jgi:hypothetical protein